MFQLLLATLVVVWYGKAASASPLEKREALRYKNGFSVPISQAWEGNDGSWSTFALQLGNKAQVVHVLPSTSLDFAVVAPPDGCRPEMEGNATFPMSEDQCRASRGGIFDCSASASCKRKSLPYDISVFQMVNKTGIDELDVDMAYDTVTLGWQGSQLPTVNNTLVATNPDMYFNWIGLLGLNPRPVNFTDGDSFNQPYTSLLQALKDEKAIPSVSFSYTAGAKYRNNVFGSLVLGGMDTARNQSADLSPQQWWPFDGDQELATSVQINSLSLKTNQKSGQDTKQSSFKFDTVKDLKATIDTNRPYFYLPPDVCEEIAKRFGLIYSQKYKHYLINETQHQNLLRQDISLEFTLSGLGLVKGQNRLMSQTITLPYQALALNLSFPLYFPGSTRYLPILPAPADLNIIGRTLLQEAILTVDYERQQFSVSPAATISAPEALRAITPLNSVEEKSGPSAALIAAIVVAIVAIIALIIGAVFLVRRRKAKKRAAEEDIIAKKEAAATAGFATSSSPSPTSHPPNSSPSAAPPPTEPPSYELDGNFAAKYETDGDLPAVEAPAHRGSFGPGEYKQGVDGDNNPVIRVYYEMDASPHGQAQGVNTLNSGISSASPGSGTNDTALTGVSSLSTSEKESPNHAISAMAQLNGPPPALLTHANRFAAQHLTPASPIPSTPAEYYSRARTNFRNHPPPASPIPETPAEYYGRSIDSRLPAPPSPPNPPTPPRPLTPPTPASPHSPTSSPSRPTPASPIPATPLEFYDGSRDRQQNTHLTPETEQRIRDWVGRAPGLPNVTLTPATPATPQAAQGRSANRNSWVGATQADWVDKGLF